jgi:nucleoside 2-deoxyribosyltransferase
MRKPRIYVAAPLFSEAEKAFNLRLRECLLPHFEVFLPQMDGGLVAEMILSGVPVEQATSRVFQVDVEAVRACDVLLILLDGRTVDEGACFELGFAYALGKLCIGLRTDPRQLLPTGNNPMIEASCYRIFGSVEEVVAWAASGVLLDKYLSPRKGGC